MSVQQKKVTSPSKMNGDNLLQLKYMKNAETSPRVLSYNMATRVEMSRKITWGFREQALNLEKVKKGQYLYYKQLKRLQQEKRSLQQQSYRYKQEEARLDVEHVKRDKRIRKVLDDYEEKSRSIIEDILKATQKRYKKRPVESELNDEDRDGQGEEENEAEKEEERRREEEERRDEEERRQAEEEEEEERADTFDEEPSGDREGSGNDREGSGNVRLRQVWKPADAEKHSERRGSVYIEYMYVKPGARTLTIEAVEDNYTKSRSKRKQSQVSPHQFENDGDFDDNSRMPRRLSLRRRSSKTVEVNLKSPNEPKTVVRSRSPEVTDDGNHGNEQMTDLQAKTGRNKAKEQSSNSVVGSQPENQSNQDEITAVGKANGLGSQTDISLPKLEMPQPAPKSRLSQQFKALPAISENRALVNQEIVEEDVDKEAKKAPDVKERMLRDTQVLIVTPTGEEEASIDSRSRSSSSSNSSPTKKAKTPKSNIEYIKQKQLEREEEKKKVLCLPYTAYTMDKEGKVVPMLGPPKPMNTEPPNNYEKYKRDKLLKRTRDRQRVETENLERFMERISEDVEAMPPPPNPNPDISIKEMAKIIGGETDEREKSLPGNLMIFLKNKYDELPEGIDPNSMEALARCKYLRDYDAEAAKEAKKSGRRQSSWQVKAQTVGNTML